MKTFFLPIYPKSYRSWGLLAIRVAAGVIFAMHGWGKLTGNPSIEMFAGMVGGLGFPMPMFFAWLVALTEFLGGIALILGIWMKPATTLLAIVMIVALAAVKKFKFPAADIDLMLLASMIGLHLTGPGMYSIEGKMHKHGETCDSGVCEPKQMPKA